MASYLGSQGSAIDQVIGHASAHPGVRKIQSLEPNVYEITVDVGIPSGALQRGESNGVREQETVRFEFPAAFPLKAPTPTLREDFNSDLPHINPFRPGERIPPCIVDGSLDELFLSRGIGGMLDSLIDWLEDAAKGRLIHPEQGWEPARRDTVSSIYIAEASLLHGDCKRPAHTFWLQRVARVADRGYIARLIKPIRRSPAKLKEVFAQEDSSWSIAVVLSPGCADVAHYTPDRTETFVDLERVVATAGCTEQFIQAINFLKGVGLPSASLERPLLVVVGVRRPYKVIPGSSDIETLGYVWPAEGRSDFSQGHVLPAGHREPCSQALLAHMSGRPRRERAGWGAVGAGSLGSKLVLHAARAGVGPELVIDREVLEPHNMARHGLNSGAVVQPKAAALASEVNKLGGRSESRDADIVDLVSRGRAKGGKRAFPPRMGFVLNTTASFAVRECLATARERSCVPRVVEASLLSAGRLGLLTVEGPERNPSANDLLAWSYVQLRGNTELGPLVFGQNSRENNRVLIGQGCGSTTMTMTDATLSGQAALMGERLLKLIDRLPSTGELSFSEWLPEGLGAKVWSVPVGAFEVVRDGATSIRIAPDVAERIRVSSSASSSEIGGVLIGRYSVPGNAFHVVDLIDAPPDSSGAVGRFVLGIEGLQSKIDDYRGSVGGALHCVGTWHSHPKGPEPSELDESTRVKMRMRSPEIPMVMLIWSPRGWSALRVD